MSYEEKDVRTVEAIEKIKAILREYDLFAAMTIVSIERCHWLYHVEPSWSCLNINHETGEAHIKALKADFATSGIREETMIAPLTDGQLILCKDCKFCHRTLIQRAFNLSPYRFARCDHDLAAYTEPPHSVDGHIERGQKYCSVMRMDTRECGKDAKLFFARLDKEGE